MDPMSPPSLRARTSAGTLAAALLLLAPHAHAVGTRVFELDTIDELSGGDLKGVAVSSDGMVRAGFTLGSVPLPDSSAVYTSLVLTDGSVLVGTSPNGKVIKVAGDAATVFAETGQTIVTALVQGAGGVIYAATAPEGKIFKLTQGKAELFATVPEAKNIWGLALDKAKTTLYAAAGPEGRVFRISAAGAASIYFQSDEPNIVSVAVADNGDVYAGSHGKGLLYKITGPGRATVLYDFPVDEVRAIAVGKGGVVYAIANEYAEAPEAPRRNPNAAHAPAVPVSAPRPKPGKGQLWRFDATGRPEKMMHHEDTHYLALALDDAGQPHVGTGADGRVYTVNDGHVVTLEADTDERQIGALNVSGGKDFVVAGDPCVFHRIVARGGPDAVWTSKVLDAGLRAKFGVLSWRASGALELGTRTGNTAAPDATWSTWTTGMSAPATVTSPGGRFVQVRARWGRDANAVLSDVMLPFVTENVRPVVLEVNAAQKGAVAKEPTKENLPASGGDPPKHDSVVKVSWKVDNQDNDALRYRVAFKREGQNVWRDATKPDESLTKTEYEWETQALPEGKYRVRVEASDEGANPPEQTQKHALESQAVLVDNTPPIVKELAITGRRLKARIADGAGPIARVEVTIDGKLEWRPLGPADGVFDSAEESVDADVSAIVPPGSHIVAVRAFDAAGNAVTREVETP